MNRQKKQLVFKIVLVACILFPFSGVNAQKSLTLNKAVSIALKNNFDILVSGNDANIARENNTPGNAGMLPTAALNGSANYNRNSTFQKYPDGTSVNLPSLNSTSVTAGAQLSWTLFDGGKMFVTKSKLDEIESLGEIQYKDKVLQTLFNVVAAYYDVVRQKQQLKSIRVALNYNKDRVIIAQAGFNAGSLLKTDLLQAKIDLNVIMENQINQQFIIVEAEKTLNLLLGQSKDSTFEITDSIPLNYTPNKTDLVQKLNSSNTSILSFQKQIDIADMSIKEFKSGYLPKVDFRAGYYFSQSTNPNLTIAQNRTLGPQVGGTVVIPLFSAGENKRKVAVAKIQSQSAGYDLQNIRLQLNTILDNTLTDFENQQKLLQIETENNELALENIKISLERLRLGQTTSLEVHLAQEDFVQSNTRLINFRYNLKLAETKLKQLVSDL
ncbi:MAG: TolC family protein [Paludibacter sp.]|nr:TolC family protein [Paludibacter sp.]